MSFQSLSALISGAIDFPRWLQPEIFSIGPISLKWYGLAYVMGFIFGYWWGTRTCAQTAPWEPRKPATGEMIVPGKRMLEDYMFWIILGIILGGRIGSAILYDTEKYLANPLAIFKIWEGGMAFHGGLIGVGLGVLWMSRTRKLPLRRLGDIVAISTPFGLFFGRLANFINAELWGDETKLPWGVKFPLYPASPGNGMDKHSEALQAIARHPSQLYEALLEGAVIFIVLAIATHKFKALTRPGLCTGLFLALYGVFRLWVETVRIPDAIPQFDPFTRGQAYSIPMVLIGLVFIVLALRNPPVAPVRFDPDAVKAPSAA